mmetsp:Transcript_112395/g.195215  ORF Transcript_112395/g.195215 Transcript_112395/m.195215 type:complete len:82 (+) Transcript_112395:175-420(+)
MMNLYSLFKKRKAASKTWGWCHCAWNESPTTVFVFRKVTISDGSAFVFCLGLQFQAPTCTLGGGVWRHSEEAVRNRSSANT